MKLDGLQKVFNYGENQVRTVVSENEVWFVGKDVAEILGYSNPNKAIRDHCKGVNETFVASRGGRQLTKVIPERDVYRLIMRSKLPQAEKFEEWVVGEVLPTIRKHGAYMTDDVLEKTISDPDYMIGLITALKEEKQRRLEVERTNNILMHVNKTYTATEIAKEIGFKSAIALNKDLGQRKIQFKQNNTWVLFSKYADKGYVEIKQDVLDNGRVIYHRRFTQLGREWLLNLYKPEGELTP